MGKYIDILIAMECKAVVLERKYGTVRNTMLTTQ